MEQHIDLAALNSGQLWMMVIVILQLLQERSRSAGDHENDYYQVPANEHPRS